MVTFENVCTVTYTTSSLNQKMRKFNMFITAICFLFLIKLRWPKNKSVWPLFRLIWVLFDRRALCSIGIVSFVFLVSTITSSRGIIENIKKVKSWGRVIFLCVVSGGSSKKITAIRGDHVKKLASWGGVMRFLKWCFPNPTSPPPS